MQKVSLLLFLIWTLTDSTGQKSPTKIYGTVNIGENISMKATEVTIQEWLCFIINNHFDDSLYPDYQSISAPTRKLFDDLKRKDNFLYLKIIRNSRLMRQSMGEKGIQTTSKFEELESSDTNYFSLRIPVTGVNYTQTNRFCKWIESPNASENPKISVSLPTVDIYKKVIENKDTINPKHCYLQNSLNCSCLTIKNRKDYQTQGKGLLRVDSYWPSDLGLFCLQGNVAEMTATEGIAVGGSFRHYAVESFRDSKQEYTKPQDWLGFRYIVTLPMTQHGIQQQHWH